MENNETEQIKNPTFWDFGLHPLVEDGIDAMRYQKPSPVQCASIPVILEGKDLIACAQTGTGKTAAYLLPVLSELASGDYPENYINALIMAPTRELAMQIEQQIDAFSYFTQTSSVSIYGGTGGIEWEQQKRALKMGADMIVATPGRLLSHLSMSSVDFSRLSFFVLDEADRMLDMGFYEDILEIYKQLPKDVQVIMFSATMPNKIRELAVKIMHNPIEINIAISRPPESINQKVIYATNEHKMDLLTRVLIKNKPEKGIIFFASKERVKQAKCTLSSAGLKVREMHSDLDQIARNEVMYDFKSGMINLIVATDILARGIDIDDIDMVINFDVPGDPEDYVHRIGRTARGTNLHGSALTFVSSNDVTRFEQIEKFLGYQVSEESEFSKGKSTVQLRGDRQRRSKIDVGNSGHLRPKRNKTSSDHNNKTSDRTGETFEGENGNHPRRQLHNNNSIPNKLAPQSSTTQDSSKNRRRHKRQHKSSNASNQTHNNNNQSK